MKRQKTSFPSVIIDQRGNAVVTVMITMFMITLLVSALVEHFLVAEANAVEESLAKLRVYWAMSGHVDYIYSRVMKDSTLGNIQSYMNDLRDPAPAIDTRTWNNYGDSYTFAIQQSLEGSGVLLALVNPGSILPLHVQANLDTTTPASPVLKITQYERY